MKELLPIIDNVERAQKSITSSGGAAEEEAIKYYGGIFKDIDSILTSFGLEAVPSIGEPFDYNVHEAIQQMPSDEFEEDVVCAEYQRGYAIGERLVRPAVVGVSLGA